MVINNCNYLAAENADFADLTLILYCLVSLEE
jgi:hypothetical protein